MSVLEETSITITADYLTLLAIRRDDVMTPSFKKNDEYKIICIVFIRRDILYLKFRQESTIFTYHSVVTKPK